ncbi:uncharacterized protein [Amphiura filiformis]|uniref:uncharacterized protein n=1 Tax=Amphiura filiformis TaxID=82378 RepID=UPI003B220152
MKMTSACVENNNVHETAAKDNTAPITQQEDSLPHITSRQLSLENNDTNDNCAESTQTKLIDSEPKKTHDGDTNDNCAESTQTKLSDSEPKKTHGGDTNDNCTESTQTAPSDSEPKKTHDDDKDRQICPRISVSEIDCPVESTLHADKTNKVPCRQLPGSPDMSPVTRRRRTALAKKALELQKDGKMTRLRVLGVNSIVLEFRDKSDDDEEEYGNDFNPGRRGSRDDSSLLWKRYKSPRSERSRTVPSIKLGECGSN